MTRTLLLSIAIVKARRAFVQSLLFIGLTSILLSGCTAVQIDGGLSKPHTLSDAKWHCGTLTTGRVRGEAGMYYGDLWHHSCAGTSEDRGVTGAGVGIFKRWDFN